MSRQQNIITKDLTLAETIAHRTPEVANELLIKNGYPASRNRDELAYRLSVFLTQQKDNALKALADIHPDRELLFSNFEEEVKVEAIEKPRFHGHAKHHNCCGHADGEFSNCSGCGGSCSAAKPMHFNANGNNLPPVNQNATGSQVQSILQQNMLPIIAIVVVAGLMAMTIVTLSKTAK